LAYRKPLSERGGRIFPDTYRRCGWLEGRGHELAELRVKKKRKKKFETY
jgi:hypothetical protein